LQKHVDLVYDIGANNGDDTAHYLSKDFRVVAVEADPTLMPRLRERFAVEIASGALTLLNVALAATRGSAQFWICEGYSLWNSFDREIASRDGRKSYAVELECWPLRDLFAKFGVPHYLKLSLHGHEHFCLVDITRETAPSYLSLELPRELAQSEEILTRLSNLGYGGFKIIDQTTQIQLLNSPPTTKGRLKRALKRIPVAYRGCEAVCDWAGRLTRSREHPAGGTNSSGQESAAPGSFPVGSSGPFGEQTHGAWRSIDEVRRDWKMFLSGDTDLGLPNLSIWHDLHAKM